MSFWEMSQELGTSPELQLPRSPPYHLRLHMTREAPRRPPQRAETRKTSFWEMSQALRTSPEMHLPTNPPTTCDFI